jgi:hypothetical protein
MRKITSYLLLFIYANGLLAPVSPIIGDVMAHAFWRAQHMATVHCVNGKYHVHYELYNTGKKDNKGNSTVKADEAISIHIQPDEKELLFTFRKEIIQIREGVWLQNPFIKISSPPPRIA